ncbi:MAG: hypothetical protein AAF587_44975, partial [Bacteroidota bacterium]
MPVRFQSTGRGPGRGGRGSFGSGRGYGRFNSQSRRTGPKELKFHPLIKGKSPEYSFDEVLEKLVMTASTKKMDQSDDVIDSVRLMTPFDIDLLVPVEEEAEEDDETDRIREQERLRDEYWREKKKWDRRKENYNDNRRTMYGIILGMCTEAMKEKLRRESDFQTTLYEDNVQLLERIRKFMTTSDETEWDNFGLW